MSTARLETWAWVAIYAGLALVGLGVALQRHGAEFGPAVTGVGIFGIVAGVVMIWIRSRRKGPA